MHLVLFCISAVVTSTPAIDDLEAWTLSAPGVVSTKSLIDLIDKETEFRTLFHRVTQGVLMYREATTECEKLISLIFATKNFPYLLVDESPPQRLVRLKTRLDEQIAELADELLTDRGETGEVCQMSQVQKSIAQVFERRRSSLFERLFGGSSENALFMVTLGLHYNMMSVTMLAIGYVMDIMVPREWDTALMLTTLRLDFAVWKQNASELEQPFAANFHEHEIPIQDFGALFRSVRKYKCLEGVSAGDPTVGSQGVVTQTKVKKICRVIAAGFKSWKNVQNIQDISDSLGSAIRTIVNEPNK